MVRTYTPVAAVALIKIQKLIYSSFNGHKSLSVMNIFNSIKTTPIVSGNEYFFLLDKRSSVLTDVGLLVFIHIWVKEQLVIRDII